jgi:hypothetical protein
MRVFIPRDRELIASNFASSVHGIWVARYYRIHIKAYSHVYIPWRALHSPIRAPNLLLFCHFAVVASALAVAAFSPQQAIAMTWKADWNAVPYRRTSQLLSKYLMRSRWVDHWEEEFAEFLVS